jgi:hypothetical protein
MFRAIRNLLFYRILGGRVMLALALLGFVRRLLGGRRRAAVPPSGAGRRPSVYQPSQGSSQTVQREPR